MDPQPTGIPWFDAFCDGLAWNQINVLTWEVDDALQRAFQDDLHHNLGWPILVPTELPDIERVVSTWTEYPVVVDVTALPRGNLHSLFVSTTYDNTLVLSTRNPGVLPTIVGHTAARSFAFDARYFTLDESGRGMERVRILKDTCGTRKGRA